MAFDELISTQVFRLGALSMNAWARWAQAANRARTSAYTLDDLYEDVRSQFVESWDAWNSMMDAPIQTQLPTVTIQAKYDALIGKFGDARVRQRLTNMNFLTPPLEQLGGAGQLGNYTAGKSGAFDGVLTVSLQQTVAQPAGNFDVYRGLVLVSPPGANQWAPASWVVVIANRV